MRRYGFVLLLGAAIAAGGAYFGPKYGISPVVGYVFASVATLIGLRVAYIAGKVQRAINTVMAEGGEIEGRLPPGVGQGQLAEDLATFMAARKRVPQTLWGNWKAAIPVIRTVLGKTDTDSRTIMTKMEEIARLPDGAESYPQFVELISLAEALGNQQSGKRNDTNIIPLS